MEFHYILSREIKDSFELTWLKIFVIFARTSLKNRVDFIFQHKICIFYSYFRIKQNKELIMRLCNSEFD